MVGLTVSTNPSAIEDRHDMNVMGRITQHILNDLRWAG